MWRLIEIVGQVLDMIGEAMQPDPNEADIPMNARGVLGCVAFCAAAWLAAWLLAAVV